MNVENYLEQENTSRADLIYYILGHSTKRTLEELVGGDMGPLTPIEIVQLEKDLLVYAEGLLFWGEEC